jgi:adenylate cyclase
MAHLEVLEGLDDRTKVVLDDAMILGRSPDNAIWLPDDRVSRQHACIRRQGRTFVIEDLNSTNGVLLRGGRIAAGTPCELHDGDEIRICSIRFVFHTEPATPPPLPKNSALALPYATSTPPPSEVALEGDFGTLSLTLLRDDAAQPHVAVALDASANMTAVDDNETQTDKGLQDALKRLQAICQVSTALGAIADREQLLQRILDCIFDIFPAAERSFIMLREKHSGNLVPVVAKKRQELHGHHEQVAISRTIVNEVVTQKRSVLSFDAMGDERFNEQASIINLSIRSMMCAPLLVGNELLGLIQVDTRTGLHSFVPEDLHVLTGISAQAAIAVKNLQLYEAIETETARRTSLERYFSPGLVKMLMSGDVNTALGGSAYQGTVLFCDIIGFTAMSESMPPAEVVARLNRYFTIMQKLIYDNGGNVDKFSGDAIMAFWGVPRAGQDDLRNAVRTAIQMQEHLWSFNLELASEGQQPIHMGVGLNTGEFVAGNIGSEDKIEFTLIGDTVNLASRIEDLAGRSQVFVSETTWAPIRHLVCAVRLPSVKFKGKSKPVTVYSIRAVQDAPDGTCILALPCHFLDATGSESGHGIITGLTGSGTELQLFLYTDVLLIAGEMLTIRLAMHEHHPPLCFSATLASSATEAHTATVTRNRAVLTGITDPEVLAFFTPGSCLTSLSTWDDLDRA